ncbi:hypothetical protein RMSM_00182 [Rhodopirellula maiorica SM1]|uniref:Uncharacterized protein n=1 Tax=Rhodopirellula maiorica SM1 TaxID=1265738 RepID=M5S5D4_9BACT|nr:hypothetical protein RMSM_00182 [Rhodopirellula maiorica SM1]
MASFAWQSSLARSVVTPRRLEQRKFPRAVCDLGTLWHALIIAERP